MPDSYPFTTYSGLLEPRHYKQIGSALWLFLWCISSTTKDVEKDGVTWGVVLGSRPVKITELEEAFGVTDKTVRSWIKTLEQFEYIKVTRAPYGLIFSVRNSKKFNASSVENYRSRSEENYRSLERDRKKTTDQREENYRSNKDITKSFTAINTDDEFGQVFKSFCEIHLKIETQVNMEDVKLMQQMIALGVPSPLIIQVMSQVHNDRTARGAKISTFAYYKGPILDAWETAKAITEGVPASPVALGEDSITNRVPAPVVALGTPRKTKQQRDLDELERMQEEERQREQIGSH